MRGRPAICGPGATMPEHPIPQTLLWTGGAKYLCLKKDEKSKDVLYLTKQVTDILMQGSENVPANNLKPPTKPEFLPSFQKHLHVLVQGRPNRPLTFLESIVTGHRNRILSNSPDNHAFHPRDSILHPDVDCSVVQCVVQCGTVMTGWSLAWDCSLVQHQHQMVHHHHQQPCHPVLRILAMPPLYFFMMTLRYATPLSATACRLQSAKGYFS